MLDKNDLKSIEKIVRGSEDRLNNRITGVEVRLDKKIDKLDIKIDGVETRLNKKIDGVEKRITSTLSREITDLANINRAVITRTEELDYRLRVVESKLGLLTK